MDYKGAEAYVMEVLRRDLPSAYVFHNWSHTRDVIGFATRIAGFEGVTGTELELLRTAALFHDTGYLSCYEKNEESGAAFAGKHLPGFGYDALEIATVRSLILATAMPQRPHGILQMILCDADLFYLVTDDFWPRAELLRRELAGAGRVFTDREWCDFELDFLRGKHFFTVYCEEKYQAVLPGLLEKIAEMRG